MAYEVTATKERPRDFSSLAGQEFVVSTLTNAILSKRIAHAYLFSGPRGVGKTSAARILARALNCEVGPTPTPCGNCTHCKEIQQGNCLDVIEIDGASNTSVNDIRSIRDEVQFAPNSCRYKIYIIDEVHMLSNSAFNALLKTIEEPPEYIIFIFATTEIHRVPATIRSRCQQFHFRLIPTETIQALLERIAAENGVEAEAEALFWIAKEATGSLRDAYTLYDQVAAFSDNHITLAKIREELGLVGLDSMNELMGFAVNRQKEKALSVLNEILDRGISAEQVVVDLADYFRTVLLIQSGITRETLLGAKVQRFNPEVPEKLSSTQVEAALGALLSLYRNLRFSLSQRFELELLVAKLCELTSFFSNRELVQLVRQLQEEMAGKAAPIPQSELRSRAVDRLRCEQAPASAEPGKPMSATLPPASSPSSPAFPPTSTSTPAVTPAPPADPSPAPERTSASAARSGAVNPLTVAPSAESEQFNRLPKQEKVQALLNAINRSRDLALFNSLTKVLDWEFEPNTLTLAVDEMYHQDMILQHRETLSKFISSLSGRPMTVQVQKTDKPAEVSEDEEQLKRVLSIFPGKEVDP